MNGKKGCAYGQGGSVPAPLCCALHDVLEVSDDSRFLRLLIREGPNWSGRKTEMEDHMITLLTMHDLRGLTAQELGELHQLFSMLLIETAPDTPDRRNILAALENIERAMGHQTRPAARPSCMR